MSEPLSTPCALRALVLWTAAQAAVAARVAKDWDAFSANIQRLDQLSVSPGPASLRRSAESTRDAVAGFGSKYGPPRAARDVPVGQCWAFPHHPLAAIPAHLSGGRDDPPPAAA